MDQIHHLADALSALLSAHEKSGREVAASVGISHSILSRLRSQRIDISSLRKLVAWFQLRADCERLVTAHLWDEITRLGIEPASFWDSLGDEDTRWFQSLPPKVQAALRALGDAAAVDESFADLLDGMAERKLRAAAVAFDCAKYPEFKDSLLHTADSAPQKAPRKNGAAPSARLSFPPRSKAS